MFAYGLAACPVANVSSVPAGLFVVENAKGPDYDHSRGRREQDGWEEHASFMDALLEQGIVLLGGPVGDGEGENTLVVMRAEDERSARAVWEADPWYGSILHLARVEPWKLWLGELN